MSAKKKYLNFQNMNNSCWMDAAVILIAHTVNLKKIVECIEDSYINKIITHYNNAVGIINTSSETRKAVKESKAILGKLQTDTQKYLKEFLKFKEGEPESAFCALLNLIYHDKSPIKEHLNTTWISHKKCSKCSSSSKSFLTKPIITLPKVKIFNPEILASLYTCTCKNEEQMKIEFVQISDTLIFHFENGAGTGDIPMEISIKERLYHVTSIMVYEESQDLGKDHFVTWIRQPFADKWLECDDLKKTIVYFTKLKPALKMENIYLVVYETFDKNGKTKHETCSFEDIMDSNIKRIKLIDLSDNIEKKPEQTEEMMPKIKTGTKDITKYAAGCDRKKGTNKKSKAELKKLIDDCVPKTFASFFNGICSAKLEKEAKYTSPYAGTPETENSCEFDDNSSISSAKSTFSETEGTESTEGK